MITIAMYSKEKIKIILDPLVSKCDHLECDGLTKVISYTLNSNSSPRNCFQGAVTFHGITFRTHRWITLKLENKIFIIDYRLRMWFNDKNSYYRRNFYVKTIAPHGIFVNDNKNLIYNGNEINTTKSRTIFDILMNTSKEY